LSRPKHTGTGFTKWTSSAEALLAPLGCPHALAQATAARVQAAQALTGWSRAHFEAEGQNINRLLERGDLRTAYTAAQRLLERCLAASDTAYQGAAYDIAMAHFYLGRTLTSLGAAEAALQPLTEAHQRFQALAEAGYTSASRMVAVALAQRGDYLTVLGRLDEAAAAYEDAIQRAEQRGDRRMIAAGKGQLGTVRRRQQRYGCSIGRYNNACGLTIDQQSPITQDGYLNIKGDNVGAKGSMSVPGTTPPPTVTAPEVIWKVQGLNVMLFGASGPCVKFKGQDPKLRCGKVDIETL
jgi:tetratricopeptide (TPR) repeat protein